MLRITYLSNLPTETLLRLEGHIAGPWIDSLRTACAEPLREGRRLTLDLSGVELIDRSALALLTELGAAGVTFTGCSSFHAEQLKAALTAH